MIAGFIVRIAIAVLVISFLVLLILGVKKIAGKKYLPEHIILSGSFCLLHLRYHFSREFLYPMAAAFFQI